MKIRITIVLLLFTCSTVISQEEIYELRTYELGFFRPAEALHEYIENALIPALNRQGVEAIGVFKESDDRLPKKVYLLIPFENIQAFHDSKRLLEEDGQYLKDAESYLNASVADVPFDQINTELIRAASGFPVVVRPSKGATFF